MQHSLRSKSDALCWHGHGPGCGLVRGRCVPTAGHHEDVWSDRVEPDESGVNRVSVIQGRGFNQLARVDGAALCVFLVQVRMEGLIMSNDKQSY